MTIKTLYANGCSWTMGNGVYEDPELKAQGLSISNIDLTQYAWPKYLGDLIGCDVLNESTGGGSNQRLLRMTTNFVFSLPPEKRKETLVVIGWTTPDRDEIYIEENGKGDWYRFNSGQYFSESFDCVNQLSAKRVKQVDKYQQTYVADIYSHEAAIEMFFQQFFLLKNLLENLSIPYLFFMALPWFWPHMLISKKHQVEKYDDKVRIVNEGDNVIDISTSFNSFIHDQKLPLTSCVHPYPIGHKKWAENLYRHMQSKQILGDNNDPVLQGHHIQNPS